MTYMIHLGYLGYNETRKTAFVPNEEIRQELTTAVERKTWNEMLVFQQESENLLDATLDLNGSEVAKQIEKIHNKYVSVVPYYTPCVSGLCGKFHFVPVPRFPGR